jgi:hypothetical protein
MNQAANVVPLRQRPSAITVVPRPQVLTEELVSRMRILNHQVRWLRANNHATLSINLLGNRPTLVVSATAARLLVTLGHGKLTVHRIGEDPVHSVVIAGCKFEWRGQRQI